MKPQSPLWVAIRCIVPTLFALGFLLASSISTLKAQCPLSCLGQTNLSLGPDGEALFTPSNGLANIQAQCIDDYTVMLFDVFDVPVPNPVNCGFLDQQLTFKITYTPNGNHCWGQVLIEDKLAPNLICPNELVHCNDPSGPEFAGVQQATDNCDPNPEILLAFEEIRDLPCNHPDNLIREIERHWFAQDASGNNSPLCIQLIQIERATLSDVLFPGDLIGGNAIPCHTPDIDPAITGYPLLFGGENDPLCKVLFNYEDDTVATCPGGFLVNRTWTALDCCTSEILTAVQVIDVLDLQAPFITCPADLTINTKEDTCTADFSLPMATATDLCSSGVIVTVTTSWGGIGPGPYTDIPEGGYKVHYTAVDSCGNISTCTMDFVIKDQVPPVAICKLPVRAYLNAQGKDTIRFEDVDAGSFDNCSMTMGQIKLMGEPDSLFRDSILVDCSFIDKDTMIILRVSDCFNNTAICMTPLETVDTLPPFFLCPPDTILSCTAFQDYPDIGGVAFASDNCAGHTLSFVDSTALNDCGVGEIERTWQAEDTYGNIVSCTQIISLVDSTEPVIIWPEDITVDCGELIDPLSSGEPIVEENCALLAIGFQDSLIIVDQGCDTLFRIWRIKDWCSDYDTMYIQRIDLVDPVPIINIDCPDDISIFLGDSCEIYIDMDPAVAFDECGHYTIITNDSPFADEGADNASGIYPIGEHTVTFTIRDACSLITCATTISVRDTVPPFMSCVDVVTCIEPDGTFMLDPQDFIFQLYDLCGLVTLSASGPVDFTCDDILKSIHVTITAMDPSGNSDSCEQILFLLNCDDACDDGFTGGGITMSGKISGWDDKPLSGVPVAFDFGLYQDWTLTDQDGNYESPLYPSGTEVQVKAFPITGDLEGITTADLLAIGEHLTGVKPFENIGHYVAADVNQSGFVSIADMVALRKAILHQIAGMEAGFWRMVPMDLWDLGLVSSKDHRLWDGSYHLLDVAQSVNGLDFIAVKVGDVDLTSSATGNPTTLSYRYIAIQAPKGTIQAGEVVHLSLSAAQAERLAGFQFSLGYAPNAVQFEGVQPIGIPSLRKEHIMMDIPGRIRFSWDNVLQPVNPGAEPMLQLRFKALKTLNGHDWLWLETQDYPAEMYYAQQEKAAILLQWKDETKDEMPLEPYLYPAEPNPFADQTRISFDLPIEGPVWLSIYQSNGALVYERRNIFPSGKHDLIIQDYDLPAKGTYMVQLKTTSGVLVRQMVKQ